MIEVFAAFYISSAYRDAFAFIILILVLPSAAAGLLRREDRREGIGRCADEPTHCKTCSFAAVWSSRSWSFPGW